MIELTPAALSQAATLAGAGLASGYINTLAGGGSLLTVPLLIMLGLPAERANATNRVCVLGQSIRGAHDFRRAGQLDSSQLVRIVVLTGTGAALGALTAAWLPPRWFHWLILATMSLMATLMLVKKDFLRPHAHGKEIMRLQQAPRQAVALWFTGFYGGFLQAGVGLLQLWVLVEGLHYSLNGANAIKTVVTGTYTVVALAIFVYYDLVDWLPGLWLTVGTLAGARLAVRSSLTMNPDTLRRLVLSAVLLTLVAAATR